MSQHSIADLIEAGRFKADMAYLKALGDLVNLALAYSDQEHADADAALHELDAVGRIAIHTAITGAPKPSAPPNGDHNPARPGDCATLCGAPGCASWGCLA